LRSSRTFRLGVGVLFFLALALRLVYLSQLDGSPLLTVLMGDARVYDQWAVRLADGEWMGTEIFYQTPLYPYLLGVVYLAAGHDPGVVRVIQAFLGAGSCVMLALAGRLFFSEGDGLIAAFNLPIYPPAIFFDGLIQKSSLDLFLTAAILALLGEFQARTDERRRWTWLGTAGILTGALVLNRENAFVLFPVVALWLLVGLRDAAPRVRAGWIALFAGAAFLVLLPVGLRNRHVGGEFVLSTSQLGPNFYIGNNPNASGSYESLLPGRGDPIFERADATALASQAAGRALSPREVSRYWLQRSFAYIRTQPLDWVRLSGHKLLLTVNAKEISDTESLEAYAESAPLLNAVRWLDFGILLPLAAFGAWMYRRTWRRQLLLYLAGAGMTLAIAAFFVVARYRHPLTPVVILFAGAGVGSLVRMRVSSLTWIPAVVVAGVFALVAHLPMHFVSDQTYINLGGHFLDSGRPGEALPWLRRAVSLDPSDPIAQESLAVALMKAGESNAAEAIPHFTEAVRLRPASMTTRINFGTALCGVGRIDEGLAQFQEAERLDPKSVEPLLMAARAHAAAGDFDAALVKLEQARTVALETGQGDRAREFADMIRQTRSVVGR
jgi:4-amino-4-deoxy-L-arabinose transferase-like glycosyltransferase